MKFEVWRNTTDESYCLVECNSPSFTFLTQDSVKLLGFESDNFDDALLQYNAYLNTINQQTTTRKQNVI